MSYASEQLRNRLRFPVGGRSVARIKQDAKALSRSSEVSHSKALDQISRQYGIPLPWNEALAFLEQYDRLIADRGQGFPGALAEAWLPTPGGVTLMTAGPATGLHAITRGLAADMVAQGNVTAIAYQDAYLVPGKNDQIGNERRWLAGAEIGDILNSESLPIDEAIALASEMTLCRDRMQQGIRALNEWRTELMQSVFCHTSRTFPGERFKWSEDVLYVGATPYTLQYTTDALSAAQLGARCVCVNNFATSWEEAMRPVTWGVRSKDQESPIMHELLSRVELVVNRQTVLATAEGPVIAHQYAFVPTELSSALRENQCSVAEWVEEVTHLRVPFADDIEQQVQSGAISQRRGEQALEAVAPSEPTPASSTISFRVA